jgi:hypothetical protein
MHLNLKKNKYKIEAFWAFEEKLTKNQNEMG